MILAIQKDESGRKLIYTKFTITAKIKLTEEEFKLINRFRLDRVPVLIMLKNKIFSEGVKNKKYYINNFISGVTFSFYEVINVYKAEQYFVDSFLEFYEKIKPLYDYDDIITYTIDEDLIELRKREKESKK